MNVSRETLQKEGQMNTKLEAVTAEIAGVNGWLAANVKPGVYFDPNVLAAYRKRDELCARRYVLRAMIDERSGE